ncbi:hypothetical protein RJ639_013661, partial [Escallonia herrerae]
MNQQAKSGKKLRKRDPLLKLPDEIICPIISKLSLKEAVRTSVLSKSWRYIWASQPNLLFDSANILGNTVSSSSCQTELDWRLQRCMFIERVNCVLHQRCNRLKIESLTIHYHLGQDSASRIDNWVSYAVTKGVEKLDLDFTEQCSLLVNHTSTSAFEPYTFHCGLLAAPRKDCSVKHLQLASCSLISLPISTNLASLVTVRLLRVNINDQQLEMFLSTVLCMKSLSLQCCNHLVSFKAAGPRLLLEILNIKNCFRLESITIDADNIATLEYTGQSVGFSFENVPRLAQLFMVFTGTRRHDGVMYALTRVAYDLPKLQTLNLISIQSCENTSFVYKFCALLSCVILTFIFSLLQSLNLPENVPAFASIKQLVLTVFPFNDDDKLRWISYILKAFPFLQKLQLNLLSPSFIKQTTEIYRHLPEFPHRHLHELEMNGFYGNQNEVELLKYLLENAVGLEVLRINTCQKIYKGFNNWDCEKPSSHFKLSAECAEWLLSAVPATLSK